MGKSWKPVAVASLLIVLMAGCSEIPTSGPVVAGDPVRAQEPLPYVGFRPPGPQAGADKTGIVYGFLDAMSTYQPGYEIAKRFLTPDAASTWDPSAGVTVHVGARPSLNVIDETTVLATLSVVGEVNADGSYQVAGFGASQEIELRMERVDGEWRIADPPAGTLISEDNFLREFEVHELCFFDPEFNVFVPDPVYVPKNTQVTTQLTQMLLSGPSGWLDPAVRTAFPEQVTLSVSSVPVENGIATVDLTEPVRTTEPAQRDQMAAQLVCTLAGVPEVTRVAINSEGVSLLGQGEISGPAADYERYDPERSTAGADLYAVQNGAVVRRADDELQPVPGPLGLVEDVTEVAVPAGEGRAAVVGNGQTELRIADFDDDAPQQAVLNGIELSAPVWDRNDVIWAVDRSSGSGQVVAVRPDGTPVTVRAADLKERDVAGLSVSPDGTRMMLVADGRAYAAVVVHDGEDQDHVSIERVRRMGPVGTALDATWAGADRIALLLQDEGDPEVIIVDVFGAVKSVRGPIPEAVSLAASPGMRLVVDTADETLVEHDSRTRWVDLGDGVAPAYP